MEKVEEKRQGDTVYVIRGDGGCVLPGLAGWLTLYQCGANSWLPLGEMEKRVEKVGDKVDGGRGAARGWYTSCWGGFHQQTCGVCCCCETELETVMGCGSASVSGGCFEILKYFLEK